MARTTHHRQRDHFGDDLASFVVLDDATTTYSGGSNLMDAIDDLDDRVATLSSSVGPLVGSILIGTADPSAGGGVAHAMPAMYLRDNASVTEIWIATGTADTAWTKQTSP